MKGKKRKVEKTPLTPHGKKERERSREGARAWLGSGEAHAEENKTVPAHVTYMGISLFCLDWKEDNPKLDSPRTCGTPLSVKEDREASFLQKTPQRKHERKEKGWMR